MKDRLPVQSTYQSILLALKVDPADAQRMARKISYDQENIGDQPVVELAEQTFQFVERMRKPKKFELDDLLVAHLETLGDYGAAAFALVSDAVSEMNQMLTEDGSIIMLSDLIHPNRAAQAKISFLGAYSLTEGMGLCCSLGSELSGAIYDITFNGFPYEDGFGRLVNPLLEFEEKISRKNAIGWLSNQVLPPIRKKVEKYFTF